MNDTKRIIGLITGNNKKKKIIKIKCVIGSVLIVISILILVQSLIGSWWSACNIVIPLVVIIIGAFLIGDGIRGDE